MHSQSRHTVVLVPRLFLPPLPQCSLNFGYRSCVAGRVPQDLLLSLFQCFSVMVFVAKRNFCIEGKELNQRWNKMPPYFTIKHPFNARESLPLVFFPLPPSQHCSYFYFFTLSHSSEHSVLPIWPTFFQTWYSGVVTDGRRHIFWFFLSDASVLEEMHAKKSQLYPSQHCVCCCCCHDLWSGLQIM